MKSKLINNFIKELLCVLLLVSLTVGLLGCFPPQKIPQRATFVNQPLYVDCDMANAFPMLYCFAEDSILDVGENLEATVICTPLLYLDYLNPDFVQTSSKHLLLTMQEFVQEADTNLPTSQTESKIFYSNEDVSEEMYSEYIVNDRKIQGIVLPIVIRRSMFSSDRGGIVLRATFEITNSVDAKDTDGEDRKKVKRFSDGISFYYYRERDRILLFSDWYEWEHYPYEPPQY